MALGCMDAYGTPSYVALASYVARVRVGVASVGHY